MTIIKNRRVFFCSILSVHFRARLAHPFVPTFWALYLRSKRGIGARVTRGPSYLLKIPFYVQLDNLACHLLSKGNDGLKCAVLFSLAISLKSFVGKVDGYPCGPLINAKG